MTEPQILLLTAAVLASWIPEATGTPACVELIGPNSPERRQLLRLLGSLVRRPLPLAEVQPSSLFELAAELSPTLFVLHCDNLSALRKLVNVTSSVAAHIVVNGRPVNVACAKVLCVAEPLAEIWGDWSALEIELPSSEAQLAPLDDLTLQCITDEYQGKLLQFRLANYLACQSSACDAPELGRLRELGLCLTAPLTGHPELQQQVIRLLSDQPARMEQGVDETVPAAVIEALLDFCHQAKKQTCFMGELAKAANQRLEKRGESFILTARDVGSLLSKLGFVQRPRRAQGYGIDLLNSVRQQIHRLAMKYKVANMHTCSLCCRQCHEICNRPAPVQEFNLDDLTDAV